MLHAQQRIRSGPSSHLYQLSRCKMMLSPNWQASYVIVLTYIGLTQIHWFEASHQREEIFHPRFNMLHGLRVRKYYQLPENIIDHRIFCDPSVCRIRKIKEACTVYELLVFTNEYYA